MISPPLVSIGRRVRFRHVARAVCGEDPRTVLDAGCGDARFTAWLEKRFPAARVTGIDSDAKLIERARRRHPRLDLRVGEVGSPALGDERFDLVVCTDVIEHIADDRAAMSWLAAHLFEDGRLVLHVPAAGQRHLPSITAALREEVERGEGPHLREGYDAGELTRLATEAGLREVSVGATFASRPVRFVVDIETWLATHGMRPLKLVLLPALLLAAATERRPAPSAAGAHGLLLVASGPRANGAEGEEVPEPAQ